MSSDEQNTVSTTGTARTEATVEFTYRVILTGSQACRFVRVEIYRGEVLEKCDFTRFHVTEAELDEVLTTVGANHAGNVPVRMLFLHEMFIHLPERAVEEIIVIAKELNKQLSEELVQYTEVMRTANIEFDIIDNVPISEVDVDDYEEDK